jgi:hypothetical protein
VVYDIDDHIVFWYMVTIYYGDKMIKTGKFYDSPRSALVVQINERWDEQDDYYMANISVYRKDGMILFEFMREYKLVKSRIDHWREYEIS